MQSFIGFFRGALPPPSTPEEYKKQWEEWIEQLRSEDRLIIGAPLIKNGSIITTNSAREFIFKVGEHASGFIVVKAADLEEAQRIFKQCPFLQQGGNVTIRPLSEQY